MCLHIKSGKYSPSFWYGFNNKMIVFKIKEIYFSDYKQCVYFYVLKVQEAHTKKTRKSKLYDLIFWK